MKLSSVRDSDFLLKVLWEALGLMVIENEQDLGLRLFLTDLSLLCSIFY